MAATYEEIATAAAKEIFLKMMDNHRLLQDKPRQPSPLTGTELADRRECYKTLYLKVFEALKSCKFLSI